MPLNRKADWKSEPLRDVCKRNETLGYLVKEASGSEGSAWSVLESIFEDLDPSLQVVESRLETKAVHRLIGLLE